jgi:hypothetical protein
LVYVLCLSALAASRPATAEQLVVGPRLRVTTAQGRFVGRVVSLSDEALELARGKDERGKALRIPRRDVIKLEVSERPGRRGRGATIGALVGLGAAVAIGVAGGETCGSDPGPGSWDNFTEKLDYNLCFGRTETAVLSGILTVPLGALLGAAIAPGEKWRPAGARDLSMSAVAPRGGGIGVRVSLRF